MEKDNILSTANSTVSSELSCGTHSWYVKALDNNQNSTNSNTLSFNINCGGGLIAPLKPIITSLGTPSSTTIPSDVTQIAISRTSDFKDVSWIDFDPEKFKSIADNSETLYVKFRTISGGVSDTLVYLPKTTSSFLALNEGDIVKTIDNPDVYIIKYKNQKQYKRLILSPSVFNSYGHLKWSNLKIVSQSQLDSYTTSSLVRETTDPAIYELFPDGDKGERRVLDTTKPYDTDSVYEINGADRGSYILVK
jgi:hypothetical protein